MKFTALVCIGVLSLSISSCATLSPEQCQSANWQKIGLQDGNDGQTSQHLARHQKACNKVGIVPDVAQYQIGYQAGLRNYCQPQNVFSLSMQGRGDIRACPTHQQALLLPFSQVPKDYLAAKDKVEDLLDDLDRTDSRLRGKLTEDERRYYRDQRRNLAFRLQQAQLEYDHQARVLRDFQRTHKVY